MQHDGEVVVDPPKIQVISMIQGYQNYRPGAQIMLSRPSHVWVLNDLITHVIRYVWHMMAWYGTVRYVKVYVMQCNVREENVKQWNEFEIICTYRHICIILYIYIYIYVLYFIIYIIY